MKNLIILFALIFTGCSIKNTVIPVEKQLSELCIKNNKKVLMEGFLPELIKQIEQNNIKTVLIEEFDKVSCPNSMEYTANWRWDLVMYLTYAELRVYESDTLLGKGIYDATWGGARLDKFGKTENKLKPITDELFKNQKK
ncbi:MAG: hypothetical protein RL563_2851 [Pseudomonadota bacterium]|jgi:hypothetical protein